MRLFRLPAQAEQNEIVAREDRIDDLRHNRIVVSNDSRKDAGIIRLTQASDEIFAEFVFNSAVAQTLFGKFTAAQFAKRARKTHEETPEGNAFLGLYAEEAGFGLRLAALCAASKK